jgi:hypothetical protein
MDLIYLINYSVGNDIRFEVRLFLDVLMVFQAAAVCGLPTAGFEKCGLPPVLVQCSMVVSTNSWTESFHFKKVMVCYTFVGNNCGGYVFSAL